MSRSPRATGGKQALNAYRAAWKATTELLRDGHSFSGNEPNCAFLNCRGAGFANVSAITGLDFADDGRAMGITDWDQDGDLDIWLFNRTGPRLRLMRNQTITKETPADANFVAIRLQGTVSNRDAIGARVELRLDGDSENHPLIQTLYAGDAFLSQSSKWIHFGLGTESKIKAALVRWPNGSSERFDHLTAGKRYRLVEGSGRSDEIEPRPGALVLTPGDQQSHPSTPVSRTLLANRLPAPILSYVDESIAGNQKTTVSANGQPLLVVLWASWCPNCSAELRSLAGSQGDFERADLGILALTVDGLDQSHSTTPADAKTLLAKVEFPFPTGIADRELLDKLDLVKRIVFPRATDLVIPSSFLLDADGSIAGIYNGAVEPARLLEDLKRIRQDPGLDDPRNLAVPMSGRWSNPPRQLLLRAVARMFRDEGFADDHARYLQLDADVLQRQRRSAKSPEQRRQLEQQYAAANYNLAVHLRSTGETGEALEHLRLAVAADPNHADALTNLGVLLAKGGQVDAAIEYLQRAVQLKADSVPARMNLAAALGSNGQFDQTIPHYQRVIKLQPGTPNAYSRLARSQLELGEFAAAIENLERAIALKPDDFPSNVSLAWIRATSPVDALRNGGQALAIARKLNQTTGGKEAIVIDVLAAAHAEQGDFSTAWAVIQQFLDRVGADNQGLKNLFEKRLQDYSTSLPHRDPNGKYP